MTPSRFAIPRAQQITKALRYMWSPIAAALFLAAFAAQAQSRYIISADGREVTDVNTGLVWKRCAEGTTWTGSTCVGIPTQFTHEAALVHAKAQNGWRLPNVKELTSIVDFSTMRPAIDAAAFPGTASWWYWSSTPYAVDRSFAWAVDFEYGLVQAAPRLGAIARGTGTQYVAVRLVR